MKALILINLINYLINGREKIVWTPVEWNGAYTTNVLYLYGGGVRRIKNVNDDPARDVAKSACAIRCLASKTYVWLSNKCMTSGLFCFHLYYNWPVSKWMYKRHEKMYYWVEAHGSCVCLAWRLIGHKLCRVACSNPCGNWIIFNIKLINKSNEFIKLIK